MNPTVDVRPSPISGRWYPADPRRLAESVDGYINAARLPAIEGDVIAVLAPHAGHIYSGPVAGYAFAALKGLEPEVLVVISPMHYPYTPPVLSAAHSAYGTPLGTIPIDRQMIAELDAQLREMTGTGIALVRDDPEHSLEIELPFVQRSLKGEYHLIPIMLREQDARITKGLGDALARILQGRKVILIASSDLSHFYSQDVANTLDQEMLHQVEAFDPQGVLDVEEKGTGFACGKGAVAAVLWAAKALGADTVKILRYATSGDVTGDYDQVVGYGAAAVIRQKPA
jgi:AmmeMemoRadiSam system protein B